MSQSAGIARLSRLTAVVAALAGASQATAQESAVESAADAFGERVGTEQSGLYSETQVRGFDLNDSGAYRIDDAYFSRAAALNDPVLRAWAYEWASTRFDSHIPRHPVS